MTTGNHTHKIGCMIIKCKYFIAVNPVAFKIHYYMYLNILFFYFHNVKGDAF